MPLSNLERLIRMADEVFANKSDPNQLDVNEEVMERLLRIHPSTVSEYDDGNGPVAWVLIIPSTTGLMNSFLENKISEKELFDLTQPDVAYDAVYLCSALVLEEYRRKGIAKQLALEAIAKIRLEHPIKALFVWAFSKEGELGSEAIARSTSLPLFKKIG